MSIDTVLEASSIDINAILERLMHGMSEAYFEGDETMAVKINEPTTDKPYFLLKTDGMFLKETNLIPSKSNDVDLDYDAEMIHPILGESFEDSTATSRRHYAMHGRDMLVEKNGTPLDLRGIVKVKTSESLSPEIKLALKQLWYYLYLGDANGVYTTLRTLSTTRRNYISKNKVRPIRNLDRIKLTGGRTLRYAK